MLRPTTRVVRCRHDLEFLALAISIGAASPAAASYGTGSYGNLLLQCAIGLGVYATLTVGYWIFVSWLDRRLFDGRQHSKNHRTFMRLAAVLLWLWPLSLYATKWIGGWICSVLKIH